MNNIIVFLVKYHKVWEIFGKILKSWDFKGLKFKVFNNTVYAFFQAFPHFKLWIQTFLMNNIFCY